MPSTVTAEDFDMLLSGRPHMHIVAHDEGRVVLRFDFAILASAPQMADRGKDVLNAIDGIRNVDASLLSRTIAIDYDPQVLPPEWWDKLYGEDDAEAREVIEKLKAAFA